VESTNHDRRRGWVRQWCQARWINLANPSVCSDLHCTRTISTCDSTIPGESFQRSTPAWMMKCCDRRRRITPHHSPFLLSISPFSHTVPLSLYGTRWFDASITMGARRGLVFIPQGRVLIATTKFVWLSRGTSTTGKKSAHGCCDGGEGSDRMVPLGGESKVTIVLVLGPHRSKWLTPGPHWSDDWERRARLRSCHGGPTGSETAQ
jgi:hypothetical protein